LTSDANGSTDEMNTAVSMPQMETGAGDAQPMTAEVPSGSAPSTEGRRTQLKIVRENIETLSSDIGNFRRKHDGSIRKLQEQIDKLRSELGASSVSKDVGSLRKSHDASSKRLEKQVTTLRKEVADLKAHISKDSARARAKEEAMLSRILVKVSKKPTTKSKPATKSKKKK
jgi:uncharacterized protein YlxW (UPF0749 family)